MIINSLAATEIPQLLKSIKDMIIVDVRTPEEFRLGHISGAINIDISNPSAHTHLLNLNPKQNYLIYCRSGIRSKSAANFLINNRFTNIYEINDGVIGWIAHDLPLVKQ